MSYAYEHSIELSQQFSLTETIESGQTFLWNKSNGQMFDEKDNNTYYTTHNTGEEIVVLEIEKLGNRIICKSNSKNADNIIRSRLGLEHDLKSIERHIIDKDTDGGVMEEAINQHQGMRIVNEPFFPTLISFICSTQMRVERIHQMINNIRSEFGQKIETDKRDFYSFPTPNELSSATEEDLKDLKLGYRSSYVEDTTNSYAEIDKIEISEDPSEARNTVKQFKGVGTKVADCVILYGTERMNVVPIDTWMNKAIKEYYPSLYEDSKEKMARSFEDHFGKYSGYAQAYLFHHVRTN